MTSVSSDIPTTSLWSSKGSKAKSATELLFWRAGTPVSGRRPVLLICHWHTQHLHRDLGIAHFPWLPQSSEISYHQPLQCKVPFRRKIEAESILIYVMIMHAVLLNGLPHTGIIQFHKQIDWLIIFKISKSITPYSKIVYINKSIKAQHILKIWQVVLRNALYHLILCWCQIQQIQLFYQLCITMMFIL